MPGPQVREDDRRLSESGDAGEYERQLSELLANLKTDSGNPDLWMEAATLYVALGRRRRASKAYRASIQVVNAMKTGDTALARISRLLHGDDVPSVAAEGDPRGEAAIGQDAASQRVIQETPVKPRKSRGPTAEREPSLTGNWDAFDQLQRELSPRQTVTCPGCNTLMEVGDPWCYGCGQEMKEGGESLEERAGLARRSLEDNEDDVDALFTLAAHLAVSGQHEEALEYLIRLTALDPRYPGLWWVKARVFLEAGKAEAARASLRMALEIMTERGPGPRPLST